MILAYVGDPVDEHVIVEQIGNKLNKVFASVAFFISSTALAQAILATNQKNAINAVMIKSFLRKKLICAFFS